MSAAKRNRPGIELDPQEVAQQLGVSEEYMVLGIDEAGRGPAIGPMVYTGAMITLQEHDQLLDDCHVADSKVLGEQQRQDALRKMSGLKTLSTYTVSLSATTIGEAMTGLQGTNLNTLSHDTAIEIIRQATLAAQGKLCAVYVDAVGNPAFYAQKLSGRFPHLRIVVSSKADAKYPIVSAASIVAKALRDETVRGYGEHCGCGYPSDPKTVQWLRSHVHRFFVFGSQHDYVRHSWGPVKELANSPHCCIPVLFERDEEIKEQKDATQTKLSFGKLPAQRCANATYAHLLKVRSLSNI